MKPHEAHDNLSRLTQVQCDKQVFKSQRVRNSEGHHERDYSLYLRNLVWREGFRNLHERELVADSRKFYLNSLRTRGRFTSSAVYR